VTPKRPYPDDYPSEQERQEKAEAGYFPSQIKKLPHLGGASAARITLLHQDRVSKRRVSGSIACIAPDGQGLIPSPARRNHSLPPCVDAMDGALPIDSGTHRNNVGNRVLTPCARGKIFSQTIGKRKGASRAPF